MRWTINKLIIILAILAICTVNTLAVNHTHNYTPASDQNRRNEQRNDRRGSENRDNSDNGSRNENRSEDGNRGKSRDNQDQRGNNNGKPPLVIVLKEKDKRK